MMTRWSCKVGNMENFTISSTNPNESTGGRGCLCSPVHSRDCRPPFVVFHGDELLDESSPHPVACRNCIEAALEQMDDERNILPVGDVVQQPEPELEVVEVTPDNDKGVPSI